MQTTAIAGRRFGLTADTHDDLCDWPAVAAKLKAAWGGVDAVLHCGDLTTPAALEALGQIAPVYATRSADDPPPAPPALCDGPRVLDVGGVRIGLTFAVDEAQLTADGAAALFGAPVAAWIFGGTHMASVAERGGVLIVNPGSPSLAKTRTTAVLSLVGGRPTARIIELG
jgi:putative phosphoesterase